VALILDNLGLAVEDLGQPDEAASYWQEADIRSRYGKRGD